MFKNDRLKKVLVISIILVLALSTIAVAANEVYQKKLTATFGRIRFKVDGKDVTKEIESKYDTPAFTVNSRSYVPVRAIAELMGMEVKWDGETHTAEIIDVKSKAYEEEIKKKDKEIAELKKEIEKFKKNVVEETDLKAVEKKLNNNYGTYEDVYFDITLKENKNKIDVEIVMDLRDKRQEDYWNRISYSNRKAMIEDITDIISSEFTNADIYGSVYDEYYRRNVLTFSKKKNSSLSISYDDRRLSTYDEEIDDIVYYEFYDEGIRGAYLSSLDVSGRTIYFEIDIPSSYESEWNDLKPEIIKRVLDKISDEIAYYYDYYYYDRYYDDYYYSYIEGDIYMKSDRIGEYDMDLYTGKSTFTKIER